MSTTPSPHILIVEPGEEQDTVRVECPHGAASGGVAENPTGAYCLTPSFIGEGGPEGPWYCALASMLDTDGWYDAAETVHATVEGQERASLFDAMLACAPADVEDIPPGRYEVPELVADGDVDDDGMAYSYWYVSGTVTYTAPVPA